MSSQLLLETTSRLSVLVAALSIAASAKAVASVLRTWIEETFSTRRLFKAIEDASPSQRVKIINAFIQFEDPEDEPDED